MRTRLAALVMLLLACSTTLILAQNGSDLFQQGLQQERGKGDIAAAIKIYERIVKDFPSNRPLVAKTLIQLGGCYEKLGQAKAQDYYQQVITKYSDQTDVVAQARAHLTSTTTIEIATPFTNDPYSFAISPDGRSLVFAATVNGKTSLWLRPRLDAPTQAPIPGTESARYGVVGAGANPFWSPDGRFIAYFEDQKLKKIPVGGGTPVTLASAPGNTGGTWGRNGDIVFAPNFGPLYRVSANGENLAPASTPSRAGESHRYPRFISDNRFLFHSRTSTFSNGLVVGSLDSLETTKLPNGSPAEFAPPDYLLYVSNGALVAQHLDLQKMQPIGSASKIVERVATSPSPNEFNHYEAFSVSAAGPVAYRSESNPRRRLIWRNRNGEEVGELIQTDLGQLSGSPRFSPNGRRVAIIQGRETVLIDLADGQVSRIGPQTSGGIAWAPDSNSWLVSNIVADGSEITRQSSSSEEGKILLRSRAAPVDWYGNFVLFTQAPTLTSSSDIFVRSLDRIEEPIPVAAADDARELSARFSPNGKWIAYQSDEIGRRNEVFVQPFPGTPESRRQISTTGGQSPEWSRDGREIYFLSPDNHLMVAPVTFSGEGGDIRVGNSGPLFATPLRVGSTYAPAPDGQRFLISTPIEDAPPIYVITNWALKLAASPTPAPQRKSTTPAAR